MNTWSVVYKQAIHGGKSLDDPSLKEKDLLFPQKLSVEALRQARARMGSYKFANQYLNIIIPEDKQTFKKAWFRYYQTLPSRKFTFAMIDPAIGQQDENDFTGVVVIDTDSDMNWYVRLAQKRRLTPTETVKLIFDLHAQFNCMAIGVESVAYQKALLYMCAEEMRKRKVTVPVTEVKVSNKNTKETRIAALQPRYEFGLIYHSQGMSDLETELLQFPRGSHDDVIDALAHCDELVTYPEKEIPSNERPSPNSENYEKWYIQNLYRKANQSED